jgi:hypothetical protein
MLLFVLLRYDNPSDEFVASAVVGIIFFGGIAIYRLLKTKVKK